MGSIIAGSDVGGLVGWALSGTITSSYSEANVNGSGTLLGGLVGYNTADINNSYATGDVTGLAQVGGLVGSNLDGPITNSYATGNVIGTSSPLYSETAALAGVNRDIITNSYATGNVTGSAGLIAENVDSAFDL